MKKIKSIIVEQGLTATFQNMRIGLEKESQRVLLNGTLAQSDHPSILGSRDYHPYIQTDFSETQMELITPVFDNIEDVLKFLAALHDVALRSMASNEMLWPLSMPPALPEDDAAIKIAKLNDQGDVNYRRYLAKVYGKRKQMVSGIHMNFELAPTFLMQLFAKQTQVDSLAALKNHIYGLLARKYLRYRWLITYLFGAAPCAEKGYFSTDMPKVKGHVRSFRNSQYGYTNQPDVNVSFESVDRYIADLEQLVESGKLIEAKEFYSSVRLRGGKQLSDLKTDGVQYIEIRNIDLNPLSQYGIDYDTVRFIQLFLMSLIWTDEGFVSDDESAETGARYNNQVALENPLEKTALLAEGDCLLQQMLIMAQQIGLAQEDIALIKQAQQALVDPRQTLAGRMMEQVAEDADVDNCHLGVTLGRQYHQIAHERPYQLAGYRHMELSTQIMMFDVLQKGIELEILDEADQFLKLRYQSHVEYVKNANMTSHDTYIVPLLMANKTVTKKILAEAGFSVPLGREYHSLSAAMADYGVFANQSIVIKPKSTNYGLGITIFKEGCSEADFKEALAIAFAEDTSVLIEAFLAGTEYRFVVIDGVNRAVMKRVPANVIGDGQQTIAQLVAEKNQDKLRGEHHRSPLEKIKLDEIELLALKEQGYQANSIPSVGEMVYLRENSNVSTGGDSLDVTDEMPAAYKQIAERAVEALGAKICGIDLIIPNSNESDPLKLSYGIIEANFNPAMHMHIYPFKGQSRRLTQDVLRLLYPEVQ